ncbi:GrpB family protein [Paucibacter sp. KBW04]|uniref:GrpB family protein n=1 Tax=Paucibacter sp. KBW04 TaxID=2153361 RepID=UPI000F57327B|nr:GrpB family protein [Paucibacter sp. KBW04]RQO54646.1 GrpB family protein [Paucibacter sp. KBW04]
MNDTQSLQQAIHEVIVLEAHDPAWALRFEQERQRLLTFAPAAFLDIQHIGSTAVPGLLAKPVVDVLGGVASMEAADTLVAALLDFGYTTSAEFNASLSDRRWLMRHAQGRRTHHLHLVVLGSSTWLEHLRFRDVLRADTALAAQYSKLKQVLVQQHAEDREAYTEAKAGFVRAALAAN